MLSIVGFVSITTGVGIAVGAPRVPVYANWLEGGAGVLILGGFALLGLALPTML